MSAYDWQNAWGGQHKDKEIVTEHDAYQAVSWVRRCVEVRCNALSSIPVKYYVGDMPTKAVPPTDKPKEDAKEPAAEETDWEYADLMPHILWMTEAALQVYGAAYWLRRRNPFGFEKGYRWLYPPSIKPVYDKRKGLTRFERRVNGEPEELPLNQAVWVWTPNLASEIGPGKGWLSTILTEGGIARNMNTFASDFFARGAMPGTVLSVEGNPPQAELERLEQWWKRFVGGVKRAWETVAVRATVTPIVVGYPTDQLAMPELLMAVRQQIAVAAGVPQTMLEDAANFATATEHHQAFYSETVVPEAVIIQAALNTQIFEPLGIRCVIDWQSLDIFQADEAERGQALAQYVGAGVPLDLAMEMLGIDLPNQMTYDQLRARMEQEKAESQENQLALVSARKPMPGEEGPPAARKDELHRWQRKSLRALGAGKPPDVDFDTDVLTADEQAVIRERLGAAASEEEVKGAFLLPFRTVAVDPIGTGLEPYNGEVVITEEDIKAAFAEWDRLMPEQYRGLLDARTEEA